MPLFLVIVFEEMGYGYDDLGHVLGMNPEELLELKDMVNMYVSRSLILLD